MRKLSAYFFNTYNLKFQSQWFKRLLYFLVIAKALSWLVYFDLYFGANSIVYIPPTSGTGLKSLAFLLYSGSSASVTFLFILALIALCVISLLTPCIYLLVDALIWLAVINLHNRIYSTLTGGDYLLNQFLLFNCFIAMRYVGKPRAWQALKMGLHNLATVALIVQVCLVYFLSALAKCADPLWLSGNAVTFISRIHHYSISNVSPFEHSFFSLARALNYAVLIYQFLFPVFIWVTWAKKPLIAAGILMHLYILLIMGLPWFGLTMILSYIYFWPFKRATQ